MVIRQGDIFWVNFGRSRGSEPSFRRPALVVQSDRFNRTDLNTTIVCPITTTMSLASKPGNVRLARGEANLPKSSVVLPVAVITIDRSMLLEHVGSLSRKRLGEVLQGLLLVLEPDA